jgi:hypothetical protein
MDINELIEMFNEGDTDFIKYVNDIETFFKIVNKRGLMDELDPEGRLAEDYQNDLLLFYYQNNKEKFWEYVLKFLGDVEMVDGKPYIVLNTMGDFAEIFCDGRRNDLSKDTVEVLLNGEYDSHSYGWDSHDLTDDVYRDVIEELTKENLLHLKEYIIKTLEGQQVNPHTELLEDYAQQQGHPEYVIVDQSNIDQIVDNKETMTELMDNELSDLRGELYSIYGSAYNNAYEDELYEDVWNELSTYFEKGDWVSRPHIYKKDTEVQKYRAPIHNFESNILDFLNQNKGYSNGTLEYWGSFLGILKDGWECLSVYPSDYPDSRKVDKNINMYFSDYI